MLLVSYDSGPADAVIDTGNQHLANVLFASTPLFGQANKEFGSCVFAHLQPPRSGQQCQVGTVRVVQQAIALQLG